MVELLTEDQKQYCMFCHKYLDPLKGRRDRKYCDSICRSAYHNNLPKDIDEEIERVNKILFDNFKILQDIMKSADRPTASIPLERLQELKFSFKYYTTAHKEYRYCYYYGYAPKDNDNRFYTVVRGFDYIVRGF